MFRFLQRFLFWGSGVLGNGSQNRKGTEKKLQDNNRTSKILINLNRKPKIKAEEHFIIFKVPTFNIEVICEHLNNSQTHITYTISRSQ
jgi:hypothetical protein